MISQTTEPEYKVAMSDERPIHPVRDMGIIKEDVSLGNLSAIAIKSMQIAEDKARQNDASAMHRQAELQRIVEQYLSR